MPQAPAPAPGSALQGDVLFRVRAAAPGSRARLATLTTPHGAIETPVFMPVGTRGTVRTQTLGQLAALDASILLANTYHLMIRPGLDVFERFGGLHAWMAWDRPILTDSGGFQIFSLPHGRTLDDDGAELRPSADGERVWITPERSIAMQRAIGADIMMALDQCIASTSTHAEAAAAMARTHRWARRSLAARGDSPQALFAIVQGACFEELRRASAAELTSIEGFDGFAIGGLAVGETRAQREDLTELTASLLPDDRPRYLMGVGTPVDLLEAVHRGVDMFDCVLPTALAQQGVVYTTHGRLELRRSVYRLAAQPLDDACDCEACTRYSRSYLHHLVKCQEPLGWQLLAFHNLRFYLRLMSDVRAHLAAGTFADFHRTQRELLVRGDADNPPGRRPRQRRAPATTRGAFTIVTSAQGFSSVQHVASGEVMHATHPPDVEAACVYVDASAALAQARAATSPRPLVVWDVGLGAAHNAMALVRALDGSPGHAPVELVSFEHDLDALHLAMDHLKRFPHLRHAAPHLLRHHGSYRRDGLTWRLCAGDFLATFPSQPSPDVIFYDPFSRTVDGPMWSLATFRRLFAHLAGPAELFTYSTSTAIRSSLLAAGFHVARGAGLGARSESTVAYKPGDPAFARHPLLDPAWLTRRARSTARFAPDIPPELHDELDLAVTGHPQFR